MGWLVLRKPDWKLWPDPRIATRYRLHRESIVPIASPAVHPKQTLLIAAYAASWGDHHERNAAASSKSIGTSGSASHRAMTIRAVLRGQDELIVTKDSDGCGR